MASIKEEDGIARSDASPPFSNTDNYSFGSSSTKLSGLSDIRFQIDRRSRIETFFDVLCVIGNGAEKPTHIMYRSNLSWTIMQLYIDTLVSKGLVTSDQKERKKRFQLTEKGQQAMQQYLSIKEDLDLISERNR